jgi:hypothetical protein
MSWNRSCNSNVPAIALHAEFIAITQRSLQCVPNTRLVAPRFSCLLAAAPGNELVAAFARAQGVWSEQGLLNPDGTNFFWFFGVSGNRAVLAPLGGNPEEFVRRDGAWQKRALLLHPSDPQRQLRNPTAMDGRRLLIGEQGSENALLFELHDGTWRATGVLRNANDAACTAITDSGPISLVGTLALAACPRIPRPDHDFDGRVLVYELPPLQ